MYNKIILVGNLTRDVEVKYSASNLAIGNTGIAVNRKFKNQIGEQKEEVLFVDLSFFGRTAEIANQYLRKGSKVLVEGKLKLDQWTDKTGMKRSKHSVTVESMQMLDSKQEGEELKKGGYSGYGNTKYESVKPEAKETTKPMVALETTISSIEDDGDIPF